jgi:hypothetical protein
MIDHALIDDLAIKAKDFAEKWKNMDRKAPHLVHYNSLDDDAIIVANINIYPLLSKTLDRGLDRSLIGNFFVNLGKERMQGGFPVSEIIYTVNLTQKVIIEYIMTEFAPENHIKMYQSMTVISQISEFFLLSCFYITKGYLEAVYTSMNADDSVSEDLLKKYFMDDFFFKKE